MHKGLRWRHLKEGDNMQDVGIGGRIILNCNLMKQGGRAWTELLWLRIRTSGGSSRREFHMQLRNSQLLKKKKTQLHGVRQLDRRTVCPYIQYTRISIVLDKESRLLKQSPWAMGDAMLLSPHPMNSFHKDTQVYRCDHCIPVAVVLIRPDCTV